MTKIGALWIGGNGSKKWMSGNVEIDGKKTSIIVFKNDYKKEDKHPDYNIFLKEIMENKPSQKGSYEPVVADTTDNDDDNIPPF